MFSWSWFPLILVLDMAPVSAESFPTNASDTWSVIRPPTLSSVETPVETQIRLFTIPSRTMFRTNAFSDQRTFVVRRNESLTNSSVAADEIVARIQLSDRNFVTAGQTDELRGAVANFAVVQQNASAVVEAFRRWRASRLLATPATGSRRAFAEAATVGCGPGFGCTPVETDLECKQVFFIETFVDSNFKLDCMTTFLNLANN